MRTNYILRIIEALITIMTDQTRSKAERYGLLIGTYIVHILVLIGYGFAIYPHLGGDSIVVFITVIVIVLVMVSLYHITTEFIKRNKSNDL